MFVLDYWGAEPGGGEPCSLRTYDTVASGDGEYLSELECGTTNNLRTVSFVSTLDAVGMTMVKA